MLSASALSGACFQSCSFSDGRQNGGIPTTSGVNYNGCCCAEFRVVAGSLPSFVSLSSSSWWCSRQNSRVSTTRSLFQSRRLIKDSQNRVFLVPQAAANAEKTEAPAPAPAAPAPPAPVPTENDDVKLARRAADWRKAEKMKDTGAVHRGRVDGCNSGGLLVRVGSLQGFLPFSHLNPARLPKDGSKTVSEIGSDLVGDLVSVKVIEAGEADRRLIVSEKQAVLVDIIQKIQEGNVFKGKVNFVTDYGAFVDLQFPDGSYPVSGLVHVTELSWDPIPFPQDFIAQGQEVRVKVIQIDREKSKLALSIKQLQADPLLETLDTLMPTQEDTSSTETINPDAELIGTSMLIGTALPGLEQICEYMLQEEGIYGVSLGRQALERRVVSQDLELWLSNASVEDGKFTLLARAGRQVQEVYLNTSLDRDGIKAAVQRVTGRVP